ncbi:MAG: hypothetical protein R6U52_00145 [Kosmotogaceae bacterium]
MNNSNENRFKSNMEPGHISANGFKGNDRRTVPEIIEQDKIVLDRYKLTCFEIARALSFLKEEGEKGIGNCVVVDNIFEVTVDENRGFISCPFDATNCFRKTNIFVKKLTTNETLFFSELSIHLIEKHCFFQGKGARFRIEPEKIATFLKELFKK